MDPASAAALQQMQQQMQQQAQAMHLLQQQLQQQQQQLQHQPQVQPPLPAVPLVSRPAGPRIANPLPYEGQASALDEWLSGMRQQFRWYDVAMTADADRLRFTTTYLKRPALDWWEHLGASTPTSWADFEAALRSRFQPVTSAESTRSKLLTLAQGKSSVHDYISTFRRLVVAVPDMSEADRLFQFTRGLAPAIATQLRVHGITTVDAAISMAARVGSLGELAHPRFGVAPAAAAAASASDMDLSNIEGLDAVTLNDDASGSASTLQEQFQQLLNALRTDRSPNRSYAPNPKARDVTSAIGKRFKLTPEQVREHFDKNQCFNCDGIGHSSRSCSKPPKK